MYPSGRKRAAGRGQVKRARALAGLPAVRPDMAVAHIEPLRVELDGFAWEPAWSAGDWAEHTAALGVRLDYVRRALPSLADARPARHGNVSHCLVLRHACQLLEGMADCLQRLADPDTPDRARPQVIQRLQAQRPQLVGTLAQLDQLLVVPRRPGP
jgi:hypothetical protein